MRDMLLCLLIVVGTSYNMFSYTCLAVHCTPKLLNNVQLSCIRGKLCFVCFHEYDGIPIQHVECYSLFVHNRCMVSL